jgi:chemotaxis protein CheC
MQRADLERDALTEVFNVGLSRAAKQLSLLLEDSIDIDIPDVRIVGRDDVAEALGIKAIDTVTGVTQRLSGYIHGAALLVFPSEEARTLVKTLIGSVPTLDSEDLRKFEHEAVSEIGNIIISSSVATISDLLSGEIELSVPDYVEDTIGSMIEPHAAGLNEEDIRVIVMRATLRASQREVSGSLVMLLSLDFVGKLLAGLGMKS